MSDKMQKHDHFWCVWDGERDWYFASEEEMQNFCMLNLEVTAAIRRPMRAAEFLEYEEGEIPF